MRTLFTSLVIGMTFISSLVGEVRIINQKRSEHFDSRFENIVWKKTKLTKEQILVCNIRYTENDFIKLVKRDVVVPTKTFPLSSVIENKIIVKHCNSTDDNVLVVIHDDINFKIIDVGNCSIKRKNKIIPGHLLSVKVINIE